MIHQIDQRTRVTRSLHTGEPIVQILNERYGYYATSRRINEHEYALLCAESAYAGPKHEAETEYNSYRHLCG